MFSERQYCLCSLYPSSVIPLSNKFYNYRLVDASEFKAVVVATIEEMWHMMGSCHAATIAFIHSTFRGLI